MRFGSGLFALLLLAATTPLRASEDIELSSLSVDTRGGLFELSMRASIPADDEVRAALAAGATINLRLQAVVDEQHRYWFDERVVDLKLERALSWNALSQRYVLRYDPKETGPDQQQTFATLEEALVTAGAVENWPVVAESRLQPDAAYRISARASLRRGSMPNTLRELTFWTRYWNHRSEWKSWAVPR